MFRTNAILRTIINKYLKQLLMNVKKIIEYWMLRAIQQKASNIIYQLNDTTYGYWKTEMTDRGLKTLKHECYKKKNENPSKRFVFH